MRLTDLRPEWATLTTGERFGVSFACPVHADNGLSEAGMADCMLGRVTVRTEPVNGGPGSGPMWQRTGDDFASMTLSPSLACRTVPRNHHAEVSAEHVCDHQRCCVMHWHGHVTKGEVSILPDSRGDA